MTTQAGRPLTPAAAGQARTGRCRRAGRPGAGPACHSGNGWAAPAPAVHHDPAGQAVAQVPPARGRHVRVPAGYSGAARAPRTRRRSDGRRNWPGPPARSRRPTTTWTSATAASRSCLPRRRARTPAGPVPAPTAATCSICPARRGHRAAGPRFLGHWRTRPRRLGPAGGAGPGRRRPAGGRDPAGGHLPGRCHPRKRRNRMPPGSSSGPPPKPPLSAKPPSKKP